MKLKVAQSRGIESVVWARRRHTRQAGVQEAGCGALMSLAANAERRIKVAHARWNEAVVSFLQLQSPQLQLTQLTHLPSVP
mmetsp:Transcript_32806/g.51164  ORF Transcript_32806/g.51164 Transcript_32806/m.51164 type:complete len:81 (-) Transcript_32806:223-465(-)